MYQVRKRFQKGKGFSCCFRQHRAEHSHCRFFHGYEIGIELLFEAEYLDDNNWVLDFAGMKELYSEYEKTFDHKMIVAKSDPHLDEYIRLRDLGVVDLTILPEVGCEAFARVAFQMANNWLHEQRNLSLTARRLRLVQCEVSESEKNSAVFSARLV